MFTSGCGLQLSIRVVGSRVLDHCDVVAKLGGKPNCCLHIGVCDEARHDKLVNACFLSCKSRWVSANPLSSGRQNQLLPACDPYRVSEPTLRARHWGGGCVSVRPGSLVGTALVMVARQFFAQQVPDPRNSPWMLARCGGAAAPHDGARVCGPGPAGARRRFVDRASKRVGQLARFKRSRNSGYYDAGGTTSLSAHRGDRAACLDEVVRLPTADVR